MVILGILDLLAFLYPQNLGEAEDEFFCYSFLEQIINDLQKCNNLRIPNIFDIQKHKQSSLPVNTLGRELSVENVKIGTMDCTAHFSIGISG